MIELFKKLISDNYTVKERDMGDWSHIRQNGMNFEIHSYEVESVGYFSTLNMKAMLGLMKMQTIVFTPANVDAPLFSYDRIIALGNDTLLLELYNTQLKDCDTSELEAAKATAGSIPNHDLGEHWYDYLKMPASLAKKGKWMDSVYRPLCTNYMGKYVDLLKQAEPCDPKEKSTKTREYVNGLFENGGPSTDQFIKMLGKDEAYSLFSKFIFSSDPE